MNLYLWFVLIALVMLSGCALNNLNDSPPDQPEVIKGIQNTTYQVQSSASGIGEKGVEAVDAAGDATGVKKVIKGVGSTVVETSEDIGKEQKGSVMGQELKVFPPEAEREGKVIKVDF